MNERIRELAEQATEYANEQNELHGVGYVITFKEKFAQLIVQECVVMTMGYEFALGRKDELSKAMSEHFGVEE